MPSTDFNYTDLLSLDKAKLVNWTRLNFLGSKELVLDYNGINSGSRKECSNWLEDNRLSLTDPKFGFKTYTGIWKCVEIGFNEDKSVIRQRFKVDSALTSDVAQHRAGDETLKTYYWRVVNPDDYNTPYYKTTSTDPVAFNDLYWIDSGTTENGIAVYYDSTNTYAHWNDATDYYITTIVDVGTTPTNFFKNVAEEADYAGAGTWVGKTVTVGTVVSFDEEWTKTVNDNGDGTYDVIISKKTYNALTGIGAVRTGAQTGTQEATDSIFITNSGDVDVDGEYPLRYTDSNGNPYWSKTGFVSTGASLSEAIDGLEWYLVDDTQITLGRAAYRTTDDLYTLYYTGSNRYIVITAAYDISASANRYQLSGGNPIGTYTAVGTFTGTPAVAAVNGGVARGIVYDDYVTCVQWKILNDAHNTGTGWFSYSNYLAGGIPITTTPWYVNPGGTVVTSMVAEIGRTGPAYKEDSSITINSDEEAFTADGGTVVEPVAGEIKSISNTPLPSGRFRTTVTTRTALPQRIPAIYGLLYYSSNTFADSNGILHGKNQPQSKFDEDLALLSGSTAPLSKDLSGNSNSVSVTLNPSGLLDYTILSNKPK